MRELMRIRVICLLLQLSLSTIILATKSNNIAIAQQSFDANPYVNLFVYLSFALLGSQLLVSMIGLQPYSSFLPLQITLQAVGVFSYTIFILLKMHYRTIGYIWGVFCLLPWVIEAIATIYALKDNMKYSAVSQ